MNAIQLDWEGGIWFKLNIYSERTLSFIVWKGKISATAASSSVGTKITESHKTIIWCDN